MDQYRAMYERHQFCDRMENLIIQYYHNQRHKVKEDDPDAAEKRGKINERCIADLKTFRRHFFGKKWAPLCQFCNYYDYWEKHNFSEKAGDD